MKKLNLTTLLVWACFGLFFLPNCGPTEPEIILLDDEVENEFVEEDAVEVEHEYGVSPCPQNIADVNINKHSSDNGSSIDSVSIKNSDPRLNVVFLGTTDTQYKFGSEKETECSFEFTCSDDESFESTVEFECFSNGTLVSTESVGVKVVVSR